MRVIVFLVLVGAAVGLAGCSSSPSADVINALSKDQNTVSVHQTFTGYGVNETIDYVRSGGVGPASAGTNGATAPNGSAGNAAQTGQTSTATVTK